MSEASVGHPTAPLRAAIVPRQQVRSLNPILRIYFLKALMAKVDQPNLLMIKARCAPANHGDPRWP